MNNRTQLKKMWQVTIPNVAGLSEKVKRSFSKFGTATSYKPCRIVHSQLVHVKDKKCDLVYGIRCGDPSCTKTDIGETRQTLKAHMNQHRYPAYEEALNSAVYMHLNLHGHSLDKSSGHLGAKKKWFAWGAKESIWEKVESPSLKRGPKL